MLTRSQVAKRLGRSIATVRRMEGVSLHPWCDDAGVHRFDASEVEDLSGRSIDGARSDWFEARAWGSENDCLAESVCSVPDDDPPSTIERDLRQQLAAAERRLFKAELQLDQSRERERALVERNNGFRDAVADEVCSFIDSLSARQAKQLGFDRLELLVESLRVIHAAVG